MAACAGHLLCTINNMHLLVNEEKLNLYTNTKANIKHY